MKIIITESQYSLLLRESSYDAVLIGGLDYRKGDYPIDQQVDLLKQGYGSNKNVKGFRYNTPTSEINKFLKDNPNVDVIMFSAGGSKSNDIVNSNIVNPENIYIIEPYGVSSNVKNIVSSAVSKGVPSKNVFVGPTKARGKDIVSGASEIQKGTDHWGALSSFKSGGRSGNVNIVKPKNDTPQISFNNDRVINLQKALKRLGYDLGSFGPKKDGVDGKFGKKTKKALKNFQYDNKLYSSLGKMDEKTINKLSELLK